MQDLAHSLGLDGLPVGQFTGTNVSTGNSDTHTFQEKPYRSNGEGKLGNWGTYSMRDVTAESMTWIGRAMTYMTKGAVYLYIGLMTGSHRGIQAGYQQRTATLRMTIICQMVRQATFTKTSINTASP